MRNPYKALEAIHRLVGGGFGMDMEWLLYGPKKEKVDKRLLDAAKMITEIYCISHAETSHGCKHPDWEEKKYEILKQPEE